VPLVCFCLLLQPTCADTDLTTPGLQPFVCSPNDTYVANPLAGNSSTVTTDSCCLVSLPGFFPCIFCRGIVCSLVQSCAAALALQSAVMTCTYIYTRESRQVYWVVLLPGEMACLLLAAVAGHLQRRTCSNTKPEEAIVTNNPTPYGVPRRLCLQHEQQQDQPSSDKHLLHPGVDPLVLALPNEMPSSCYRSAALVSCMAHLRCFALTAYCQPVWTGLSS